MADYSFRSDEVVTAVDSGYRDLTFTPRNRLFFDQEVRNLPTYGFADLHVDEATLITYHIGGSPTNHYYRAIIDEGSPPNLTIEGKVSPGGTQGRRGIWVFGDDIWLSGVGAATVSGSSVLRRSTDRGQTWTNEYARVPGTPPEQSTFAMMYGRGSAAAGNLWISGSASFGNKEVIKAPYPLNGDPFTTELSNPTEFSSIHGVEGPTRIWALQAYFGASAIRYNDGTSWVTASTTGITPRAPATIITLLLGVWVDGPRNKVYVLAQDNKTPQALYVFSKAADAPTDPWVEDVYLDIMTTGISPTGYGSPRFMHGCQETGALYLWFSIDASSNARLYRRNPSTGSYSLEQSVTTGAYRDLWVIDDDHLFAAPRLVKNSQGYFTITWPGGETPYAVWGESSYPKYGDPIDLVQRNHPTYGFVDLDDTLGAEVSRPLIGIEERNHPTYGFADLATVDVGGTTTAEPDPDSRPYVDEPNLVPPNGSSGFSVQDTVVVPIGDRLPAHEDNINVISFSGQPMPTPPVVDLGLKDPATRIYANVGTGWVVIYENGSSQNGWSIAKNPNDLYGFTYDIKPPGIFPSESDIYFEVYAQDYGLHFTCYDYSFETGLGLPYDVPTKIYYEPYAPVVDLNMVRATLTNRARYYIARGMHDGTILQPVRYVLGAGWESPRWGEPPLPAPDSTEVSNPVFEADIELEIANEKTLVLSCHGPEAPSYRVQEVMVYARILNTPYPDEVHREIPFACATFPEWFHAAGQKFSARLVIPM